MSKQQIEQIRLGDIVIDLSIRTREPEEYTVNEYRHMWRAGRVPPPMVLERQTKRLVCGHHRYTMYRAECEPTFEVDCILEDYESELALWKRAVSDNITHGRQLDTWDKKRILLKLQELGASNEEIATLLAVETSQLEKWAGMMVVIVGQRNGQPFEQAQPVKAGMGELIGQRISQEKYELEVVKNGTGVNIRRHAFAIRRLLKNDWIEDDAKAQLQALYEALGDWLGERAELAV